MHMAVRTSMKLYSKHASPAFALQVTNHVNFFPLLICHLVHTRKHQKVRQSLLNVSKHRFHCTKLSTSLASIVTFCHALPQYIDLSTTDLSGVVIKFHIKELRAANRMYIHPPVMSVPLIYEKHVWLCDSTHNPTTAAVGTTEVWQEDEEY